MMQKLALVATFLIACGGGSDNKVHIVTDSGSDGSDATCNPLAQTGCNTGEKCTWIYDLVSTDGTNVLGHVGCAPEGDKAVGAQCTRNAAGPQGYDDCTKVGFCKAKRELVGPGGTGVCEQICDNNGGDPMCGSAAACVAYHNIFEVSSMNVAGVCDVKCDPFADNDPLHSDPNTAPNRPGTMCQSYEGCYGNPGQVQPTSFSCAREYNTDLHDRDECTDTSGNSLSAANPLGRVGCATASNGCAEGYMPLLIETTGSTTAVCIAMCKPKSCWMGNCGGATAATSYLAGDPAGRQCIVGQIQANTSAYHPATPGPTGTNGDQCIFNWQFEIDGSNMFHTSPYDDTMGWCEDHSYYHYDSNGDGTVTTDDLPEPKCDTFGSAGFGTGSAVGTGSNACSSANNCVQAGNFGCTSTTDSGLLMGTFQNKLGAKATTVYIPRPRMPYGATQL